MSDSRYAMWDLFRRYATPREKAIEGGLWLVFVQACERPGDRAIRTELTANAARLEIMDLVVARAPRDERRRAGIPKAHRVRERAGAEVAPNGPGVLRGPRVRQVFADCPECRAYPQRGCPRCRGTSRVFVRWETTRWDRFSERAADVAFLVWAGAFLAAGVAVFALGIAAIW